MPEKTNLEKLEDILKYCADLIRQGEGNDDPVLVSDMKEKLTTFCGVALEVDDQGVLNQSYSHNIIDTPTPVDTVDYYRKLLTNLSNLMRYGSEKLSIEDIENRERWTVAISEDSEGKTKFTVPTGVTYLKDGHVLPSVNKLVIPDTVSGIGGNPGTIDSLEEYEGPINIAEKIADYASKITLTSGTRIGENGFSGNYCVELNLPDTLVSIGKWAFSNCYSLKNITIPDSVTSIGENAFYTCRSLENVVLPRNLSAIKESTFEGCVNLKNVVFPENLLEIDMYAFTHCNALSSIILPEGFKGIFMGAFSQCVALTKVTLPSSLTGIVEGAFTTCPKLIEIINKSNLNIVAGSSSYGGIARNAKQVITNEADSKITKTLDGFVLYTDTDDTYLVGYEGSAKSITVPSNVTSIYGWAFEGNYEITDITIPNTVTSLGGYIFESCISLKNITINANVEEMTGNEWDDSGRITEQGTGDYLHYYDSVENIVIGDNIKSIDFARYEHLKSLTIGFGIEHVLRIDAPELETITIYRHGDPSEVESDTEYQQNVLYAFYSNNNDAVVLITSGNPETERYYVLKDLFEGSGSGSGSGSGEE